MPPPTKKARDIEQVAYRPAGAYALDLEIFTVSSLLRRSNKEHLRRAHRYDFHMLVLVTRGSCTPGVDFLPLACGVGSIYAIQPLQTHRFGLEEDWDGLILLFKPEFLQSSAQGPPQTAVPALLRGPGALPTHLQLAGSERRAVLASLLRMKQDAAMQAPQQDVHTLLRHQLHALLWRLRILQGLHPLQEPLSVAARRQFQRFQRLVETNFCKWHQVARYAASLGCPDRSLSRSSLEIAGMTAKAFVDARISLEAKRWLVHSSLPITQIAERLGFDEPSYFVKFFRRQVGCTPGEFRREHGAAAE